MYKSDDVSDDPNILARQCPTTWFSRLENALATGDFEAALEADRELKRLGVRVRFPSIREAARTTTEDSPNASSDDHFKGRDMDAWLAVARAQNPGLNLPERIR